MRDLEMYSRNHLSALLSCKIKTKLVSCGASVRLRLTMLTPPEWCTEHMVLRKARPMVVPWKGTPLRRQEG